MVVKFGSNILSQTVQRQLGRATTDVASAYERLSSGQRITKASDDAAGLAISESLRKDVRLLNQGIRNLNDGISLLNIADSSLSALTDIVTRQSELAQQAANATLSNIQRVALDREAQSLAKEYNRIARTTQFNGRNLFDADFGELSLVGQAGSNGSIAQNLGGGIGTGTFNGLTTVAVTAASTATTAADLNGDSFADVIVTDSTQSVQVYLNNGNGSFAAARSYANITPSFAWRINAADMNGDGSLDIVTSDIASGFSVLLNRGDGTFSAAVSYATGGGYDVNPNQLVTKDVNGDSILDVVTSNGAANMVSVFLGRGDGTLQAHSTFASPATGSVQTIAAGDFNNDGKIDLSISNSAGNQETLLGKGDGTFASASIFNTGISTPYRSTESADLDGDGNLDLAIIAQGFSALVYFGNGDGSFGNSVSFSTVSGGFTGVTFGDFNGDGGTDLALRSGDTEMLIAFNNNNRTFSSPRSYAVPQNTLMGWGSTFDMSAADFNNDGAIDLLSTSPGDGNFSILFGEAGSGVSALQPFSIRTQDDARQAVTFFKTTLHNLGIQRSKIGAFESRVAVAVSNLRQSSVVYSEAHSRITDLDVAEESSRLIRSQILQQVASALLAQANAEPQIALSLLRNQ